MKNILRISGIVIAAWLCAAAIAVAADQARPSAPQTPFKRFSDAASAFFTPLKGKVVAVEGQTIKSDLDESSGVKKGMRLDILRSGSAFIHPITKEKIGQSERPIGVAEAVETTAGGSTLKIISGEAAPGDILRITSAKIRALFYQSSDVDWSLSEEYFFTIKSNGRFDIVETPPGAATDKEIVAEAQKHNAEIVMILTAVDVAHSTLVRERILWADDGAELYNVTSEIPEDTARLYKFGEDLFTPDANMPVLKFDVSFPATMVASADVNGDGAAEVLISGNTVVYPYTVTPTALDPALEGAFIKSSILETHVWLDAADLDKDGRDEVVVTTINGNNVPYTYIYAFKDKAFHQIWKAAGMFGRVIDGELWGQKNANDGGFSGSPFKVNWRDGGQPKDATGIDLPAGVNLYDFIFVNTSTGQTAVLAYDGSEWLNLYGTDGTLLWRSSEKYGGFIKSFQKSALMPYVETDQWHISDRLVRRSNYAVTIKRMRENESIKGLGYDKSQIMGLTVTDPAVFENVIKDKVSGQALDFSVSGRNLYVLSSSYMINPMNILKGTGLFTAELSVYTLKGTGKDAGAR